MADDLDIYGDLVSALPTPVPESNVETSHTCPVEAPEQGLAAVDVNEEFFGGNHEHREATEFVGGVNEDVGDKSSEESDVDVLFEQVTASSTHVDPSARRRHVPKPPGLSRLEPTIFLGPPPHISLHADNATNYVAVSGLSWWLSDSKLRQKAEQAAPCRHVRLLDRSDNGKSHGIGIFEFTNAEGADKAFHELPNILHIVALKAFRITPVFLALARQPSHLGPSWLEGGPITQDLWTAMQKLFDTNLFVKPIPNAPAIKIKLRPRIDCDRLNGLANGPVHPTVDFPVVPSSSSVLAPPPILSRVPRPPAMVQYETTSQPSGKASVKPSTTVYETTVLPSAKPPKGTTDSWASKLEKLKKSVNKKNAHNPVDQEHPNAKRRR